MRCVNRSVRVELQVSRDLKSGDVFISGFSDTKPTTKILHFSSDTVLSSRFLFTPRIIFTF